MRFSDSLKLAPVLLIAASLQGQTITLNVDSADVESLLAPIQTQSGLGISVIANAFDGAKKVSIHVKDKPFILFLEEDFCKGQHFYYRIEGRKLYFRRTSPETIKASSKPAFYWGRFINDSGEGVANIHVYNLQDQLVTTSDSRGLFPLKSAQPGDWFRFSGPDIEPGNFVLTNDRDFTIGIKSTSKFTYMPAVIHTGIQQVAKKRNVGSSNVLTASQLQQRATPNIYNRLEGYSPGLLLTVNKYPNTYQTKHLAIGGRSTIYSGADPLIVLNGFPFIGRLEDINPDDMETITFLRDASATTLWGALSGNCVVVVTTKPAKFNHPTRISFHASASVGSEPDAFAKDMLPPVDRLFVDSFLARAGYYNFLIRNAAHPYVPELALRIKTLSDAELMNLKQLDVRRDLNKYIYRHGIKKHLSLQLSGGKKENAYLFSVGFDQSLPELQFSKTQRLNLSLNYNTRPVDGLELSATIATIYNKEYNVEGEPAIPVTYASLTDATGNPAVMSYKRNQFFIDTAGVDASGNHKLRDWAYRPLKEFNSRNDTKRYTDHRVQVSAKYNKFAFLNGLEAGIYTQYELTGSQEKELHIKDGFFVNDLVNSFTQVSGNAIDRPIPAGDIMDQSLTSLTTLNLRAQLSYGKNLGRSTLISILLGSDRILTSGRFSTGRIYDYTRNKPEGQSNLNYQTLYRQYYFPTTELYIPYLNDAKRTATNYLSYYANGNIQIKGKYHAALSVRTDRANIYGSTTNRRFKPLGSIAAAWDLSNEKFFHHRLFELVKLRTSIGLSGNPPLGVSAVQTITRVGKNENGDVSADINNPSLPNLKWETVMTYNLGVTYCLVRQVLEGTVDYYYKKSTGVVGYKIVDPTVGIPGLMDNVASMASHNIDVVLTSRNLNQMLRWRTTFLFSYLKEWIIETDTTRQPAWMYGDPSRFLVVRDRPLYGIYSFPAERRLDEAGDPVAPGKNKDYQTITNQPGPGTMNYKGRSTPPVFGSITNQFNWKHVELVFTFTYKLGHYYRQPAINYSGIFENSDPGTNDFSKRWQKPGDEDRTTVPRMIYPGNIFRDYFYIYSNPLVKRADFIRLHNINLSYDLEGKVLRKLHLRLANFYLNCDNAGIVWRAVRSKYDPDNLLGFPQPRIFTVGFRGTLK